MVCTLRSFRASRLGQVISKSSLTELSEEAYVGARIHSGESARKYEVTIKPRSKKVRVDGKAVRPLAKYFGDFNVVLFAPEDLQVVRATPSVRRAFLDRAVVQLQTGFSQWQSDYDTVLKSRNRLLKESLEGGVLDEDLFQVQTEQFVDLAAKIIQGRIRYLNEIKEEYTLAFHRIFSEAHAVQFEYELRWLDNRSIDVDAVPSTSEVISWLREGLQKNSRVERIRGQTMVGPGRDDMRFRFQGHPAEEFASQGQMRSMVLAFKCAETKLLEAAKGAAPIFLLDDVSSELDSQRNEQLFNFLRENQSQCFITTTHPDFVRLGEQRVDFLVQGGRIQRKNRA